MFNLTNEYIRDHVADSKVIYQRGIKIYEYGSYICNDADPEKGLFTYGIDGNYGDYTAQVRLLENEIDVSCDCPYPGDGCKHIVAVLLDIKDRMKGHKPSFHNKIVEDSSEKEACLTETEIRQQAIEDRRKRAAQEKFTITLGEMHKGEHLIETPRGKQYVITIHDPFNKRGHCSCPDFSTNRLNTCKHLIYFEDWFKKKIKSNKTLAKRIGKERFPFIDIYWDSANQRPGMFCEYQPSEIQDIHHLLAEYFNGDGVFIKHDFSELLTLMKQLYGNKKVRFQEEVLKRLDDFLLARQMEKLADTPPSSLQRLKTGLYPYQLDGVRFALYKSGALIGDEMGLGKTLQAIALSLLKKEVFGFNKVLIVTLASLKEQWKREIEKFTDEKAVVIGGSRLRRQSCYTQDESLFKITNYEAVMKDNLIISRFKPDLVILDEAQRIKNFTTKTAEAVKGISRKHSLVLTGTPLENKLEDVYSIVQFLDPQLLSPLWKFAADHFMLSRNKKGKILGYRNLDKLNERLKSIVIRRRKEEVLSDLPDETINNYFVDLAGPQYKIHNGYLQSLVPLLNKKFLTPLDLRRIQDLLLCMRMVCDSTYLIDRKTNISPKLNELDGVLDELVIQNGRKVVIFSEWTTMNFLIAKNLSEAGIPFVELSGKVPVNKRQCLIDEFTNNPGCKVFLSTDAGGTGLNLQAADCVVNFELPWNPAKMKQRIGRVNRIGQKSKCVNVVNLISKNSIEEKILAGIQLKTDLFKGVFDGGVDAVEFSHEKRTEMLNKLREMIGEDLLVPKAEGRPQEEIPEDTPQYLNPKVLQEKEPCLDYEKEESDLDMDDNLMETSLQTGDSVPRYKEAEPQEQTDLSPFESPNLESGPHDMGDGLFTAPMPQNQETGLPSGETNSLNLENEPYSEINKGFLFTEGDEYARSGFEIEKGLSGETNKDLQFAKGDENIQRGFSCGKNENLSLGIESEDMGGDRTGENRQDSFLSGQPPEKIEEVLNSGMQFIGGLLEIATGKKVKSMEDDQRFLRIDRQTGEVTMRFRLPGF